MLEIPCQQIVDALGCSDGNVKGIILAPGGDGFLDDKTLGENECVVGCGQSWDSFNERKASFGG